MRPGPKRKPAELKKLSGSRTDRDPVGQVATGEVHPPQWLSQTALRTWERLVPHLQQHGLVGGLDEELLALLCSEYARYVDAEESIQLDGATYRTASGALRPRPETIISRNAAQAFRLLAAECGITASARGRLGVVDEERESDEFDRYLAEGREQRAK